MSAQLTHEPRMIEQAACYVDSLGYVLCTACYHAGVSRPHERSRTIYGNCDRCGCLLSESIEVVDALIVIEHTATKIF
jgi:hypothetical protein